MTAGLDWRPLLVDLDALMADGYLQATKAFELPPPPVPEWLQKQTFGRGIRGVAMAPAARAAHQQLAMDDGVADMVPLNLPQFLAARYHYTS